MNDKKIALFLDCENISPKYIDDIFNELANYGEVIIRQAYRNYVNNNKNLESILMKYAIKPIQTIFNINSKNISDFQIVIDVMNTIYNSKIDIIVLASSDSDFTSLAIEVKSKGVEVIGFGEQKTPETLKKAYSKFIELPLGGSIKEEDSLKKILKDAIKNTCNDSGFSSVSEIGTYLKNKNSSYRAKDFGKNTLGKVFRMYPKDFEIYYKDTKKGKLIVKIKEV